MSLLGPVILYVNFRFLILTRMTKEVLHEFQWILIYRHVDNIQLIQDGRDENGIYNRKLFSVDKGGRVSGGKDVGVNTR